MCVCACVSVRLCVLVSDHAKLLWQRIPQDLKLAHAELSQLWEIGKCLWRRDFAAVYDLASNPIWPDYLVPMVTNLVGGCGFCVARGCDLF